MPPKPISTANAEHYTCGNNCDGWYLVRTPEIAIIEELMPAGASEIRHRHIYSRQFFFVLHGELTVEIERRNFTLQTGEGIEISPGQAHQVINRSNLPVRILVTSQPPSHGDRICD